MTVRNRIHIVLIEDNVYVREGWEAMLEHSDDLPIVGSYESCEEALQSHSLGKADVALVDIGLSGMSGIEGVAYISERFPAVAVIMCTVYEDEQKIFDALCAGAIGYLLKKTPPEELVKAIREAASGGSPMTPNIARKVIDTFRRPGLKHPRAEEELSTQELKILAQLAQGKSYAAIGEQLFLSVDGVRSHIRNIYTKLQVHSRGEAVAKGLTKRLIRLP